MRRKQGAAGLAAAICMVILALDSRRAFIAASEGISLCIYTVIPALFPFFMVSGLLTYALSGRALPIMRPFCRLLGIPSGGESLLAVSFLGGYPVGAKSIAVLYQNGQLQRQDAWRLLGFCNNAGPAFIFGMLSASFSSISSLWALWLLHIAGAMLTGIVLPGKRPYSIHISQRQSIRIASVMQSAVTTTAMVCGWVITFRIVIVFLRDWFLWLLPNELALVATGLLELVNGCNGLSSISNQGLRFILCSGFLSLGGLCIAMQTISATGGLGTGLYFPGKLMQCIFTVAMAYLYQRIFIADHVVMPVLGDIAALAAAGVFVLCLFSLEKKKTVAFSRKLVYNR